MRATGVVQGCAAHKGQASKAQPHPLGLVVVVDVVAAPGTVDVDVVVVVGGGGGTGNWIQTSVPLGSDDPELGDWAVTVDDARSTTSFRSSRTLNPSPVNFLRADSGEAPTTLGTRAISVAFTASVTVALGDGTVVVGIGTSSALMSGRTGDSAKADFMNVDQILAG